MKQKLVFEWLPANGSTPGTALGWTLAASGTVSHPALASTNLQTQMPRTRLTSAATANASAGLISTEPVCWRGNASGLGGFSFTTRFSVSTNAGASRAFVGLSKSATSLVTADPSSFADSIGVGFDASDASGGNWQLIRRDASTSSKVDLGSKAPRNTTDVYELTINAAANSASMSVALTNLSTGAVVLDDVTYTTHIPTDSSFLYAHGEIGAASSGTPAQIEFAGMSLLAERGASPSIETPATLRTIAELQAAEGAFSTGDRLPVGGYHTLADGGGGSFLFEGSPSDSVRIINATATNASITNATNTAPIVITTSAAHGLVTGQVIVVVGVGGNTAANGTWSINVLSATTFSLSRSRGNASYTSGGTASSVTVTTAADHGLSSGARISIGGVQGSGGFSINGTWWPIGRTASDKFTIPLSTTGSYSSGGLIGDGGLSIPSNGVAGRWLRELEGGVINVRAFGAQPSPIGSGSPTDCTAAFLTSIAACSSASSQENLHGVVWVPPCEPGFEYYIAGTTSDACPQPHLEISRSVRIAGAGTGVSGKGGSRVRFGPLCVGFRFVGWQCSSDGGDATGASVEGLDVFCTKLDDLTGEHAITRGWQSNHVYSVGDKIRPHRFHNLYYECIKAGTSQGPTPSIGDCSRYATTALPATGNRWRPGKSYSVDDRIYPNEPCGRIFRCTVAGTTVGRNYPNGEAVTELDPGSSQANCGEPDWFTDPLDPRGTVRPTIAEMGGPTWAPEDAPVTITGVSGDGVSPITVTAPGHGFTNERLVVIKNVVMSTASVINGTFLVANATANTFDLQTLLGSTTTGVGNYVAGGLVSQVTDPEPIWETDSGGNGPCLASNYEPNHAYGNGVQVFATNRAHNHDVVFVSSIPDVHVKQMSGSTEPVGFSTAKLGDTVADGSITWHCVLPAGVVRDGNVVWAARFAGAYLVNAPSCVIEKAYVTGAPTAAIGVFSNVSPSVFMAADFLRVNTGYIHGNGVCIYAKGGDSNAGCFSHLLLLGDVADFWQDPADHAVYDNSFLGNRYIDCIVHGASGYALAMLSGAGSGTLSHLYVEGVGRKSPLRGNTQVLGGTVNSSAFRLNTQDANTPMSTGGPSIFADFVTRMRETSHSERTPNVRITSMLKGSRDGSLYWNAENVVAPGTNDDSYGYEVAWGYFPGWWSLLWAQSQPAMSFSGTSSTFGAGLAWFWRGFRLGQTNLHFHFADEDNSRVTAINGGQRSYGDIVDRAGASFSGEIGPALGRYYHKVNINPNGGHFAYQWLPNTAYAANAIVVPTTAKSTPRRRAFKALNSGTTAAAEPTWPDTSGLTGQVTDNPGANQIVWQEIEGANFAFASLIEDGIVGRRIQPITVWADSTDTDATVLTPKVTQRAIRLQAQTTTSTANQVIDAGATHGTEDFTLPPNATTIVDVTLAVAAGASGGGSIKLSGTYHRDGTNAPTLVGTVDKTTKMAAGLGATDGALAINGNAVEVQVSPAIASTLDWRLIRTQTEGVS